MMNIEEFREWCLSFEGVREKMPFDKATSEYDRNLKEREALKNP